MIRMYEYEPHVDDEGNAVEAFKDFQNFLFSYPYSFRWDFPNDKIVIYGIAYRISSLRRIPDNNQITCLCVCDGSGNGSGSGAGITKIKTDVSLHGEGSEADPLGVQLSQKSGNRLLILDDGCYVGSDPPQYTPPVITLSSNIPTGEYLLGQSLDNMILTAAIQIGTASIRDVRIGYDGTKTLHAFDLSNVYTYSFPLTKGVDNDVTFKASCNDGMDYFSNPLQYKFVLPVYTGVSDGLTIKDAEIVAGEALKVTGSSFDYTYEQFSKQHLWMCCPETRAVKTVMDENGFPITTAFKKTAVKLTLAGDPYNYNLYVFDTPVTGDHYKITFNS